MSLVKDAASGFVQHGICKVGSLSISMRQPWMIPETRSCQSFDAGEIEPFSLEDRSGLISVGSFVGEAIGPYQSDHGLLW